MSKAAKTLTAPVSWRKFAAFAKEHPRILLKWEHGSREAFTGKCVQAAHILAEMIDGEVVRGFYAGTMDLSRLFLKLSLEPDGTMGHSWVEKDGKIYDATWWTLNSEPMDVYIWDVTDERYIRPVRNVDKS